MDIVTHAVSGGIMMLAVRHPKTVWTLPLAMLIAMSPDADVFACASPLEFLLWHRGITHSLLGGLVLAFVLALGSFPLWQRKNEGAWSFTKTLVFAYALILVHIWLDCFNSYGTQILQPFSDYRVRLNSLFIVDLLLLLPLLGVLLWKHQTRWARYALLWIFLYPVLCLGLRFGFQELWAERFAAAGEPVRSVTVLADALGPCYWKVVRDDGFSYYEAGFSALGAQGVGSQTTPFAAAPKAPSALLDAFAQQSPFIAEYTRFSMFLVLFGEHPWQGGAEYGFRDLRFGSRVPFIRDFNARLRAGDLPLLGFLRATLPADEDWWLVRGIELFDLLVRCDSQQHPVALRFFGGRTAADTDWQNVDAAVWQ